MKSLRWNATNFIAAIGSFILPHALFAQSEITIAQTDQPNRVAVEYVAPKNSAFQPLYDLLKARDALEKIQQLLSPFRLPEKLTIKTAECGVLNSWYSRENSGPTVTICYELLNHILESLPKEITPAGVTADDASIGQFVWFTLHEVGHAVFDIFNVPNIWKRRG